MGVFQTSRLRGIPCYFDFSTKIKISKLAHIHSIQPFPCYFRTKEISILERRGIITSINIIHERMCNNNFFCIDSMPAYNRRCSCSCYDVRRGCSPQFTCAYRRPAIQRYICRICIPRVSRASVLQSGATCANCSGFGQRAGPISAQSQRPEALDKFEYANPCPPPCAQGQSQRSQMGCRCGGCCIVLCSR